MSFVKTVLRDPSTPLALLVSLAAAALCSSSMAMSSFRGKLCAGSTKP